MAGDKKNRTTMAIRNFGGSVLERMVRFLMDFISRTIFIHLLGTTYLGVNGLFSNVLGLLSLAELGISTAISFSLYKPLADRDERKITAIIQFYKNAYRIIAVVVCVAGVSLVPFLGYIVKEPEGIEHITLIYLLFLTNSVMSYFWVYKFTMFSADQKQYVNSLYGMIMDMIVMVVQIVVLLCTRNYLLYLISRICIQQLGRFCFMKYVDHKYPYLKTKEKIELAQEDKNVITTKIKALLFHKIGTVAVYQTDSLIISSMINVTMVGLVSNFTMFTTMANAAIKSLLNAFIAGLGNIVAVETDEKKLDSFQKYDFAGFWLYGVATVCLYFLMKPFVILWIGEENVIDTFTIFLLCVNFYFSGQRATLENMKAAAGVYEQDRWIPIIEAAVNLITSVAFAMWLGLPGVYIGTFLSGIVPNISRPYVVYKYVFKKSAKQYYITYVKRALVISASILVVMGVDGMITVDHQIISFVIKLFECALVPNLMIFLTFRKRPELKYCLNQAKGLAQKVLR